MPTKSKAPAKRAPAPVHNVAAALAAARADLAPRSAHPAPTTAPAPGINAPAPATRVTLALTDVISVYMTACPNKPDTQSYTLYHCYRDGMTVADFVEAAASYGITAAKARAHLAWDLKRDRIGLNA